MSNSVVCGFLISLIIAGLWLPAVGQCAPISQEGIDVLVKRCFNEVPGQYADKEIKFVKLLMSKLDPPTTVKELDTGLQLVGFQMYQFKWRPKQNPEVKWQDDVTTFYLLIRSGELQFSQGLKAATCHYVMDVSKVQ